MTVGQRLDGLVVSTVAAGGGGGGGGVVVGEVTASLARVGDDAAQTAHGAPLTVNHRAAAAGRRRRTAAADVNVPWAAAARS